MKTISRLHKIVIVISVCLVIQLLLTWKIWVPLNRQFPLISAFNFLDLHYGAYADLAIYLFTIGCLIGLLFYPFNKILIGGTILAFLVFILEDITRFQPWLYIYALMLISIALFKNSEDDKALFIIRLILSATYIWSGLQKINHAFATETFPWLMQPLGLKDFFLQHYRLVYAVPLIEILAGIGLIFKKTYKAAGIGLIMMHIVLIYALGPFGNSWNRSIWPWDISLVIILWLSVTENYQGFSLLFTPLKKSGWFIAIMITVFVMPIFGYAGWWDYYPSGNLYSGNSSELLFCNDKNDNALRSTLMQYSQTYFPEKDGECYIVDTWALHELNAPLYPEDRYYGKIGKYLCTKVKNARTAKLVIIKRQKITSKQTMQVCPCDSLLKSN
jgi:uncharacterized membrane protein YphA (DoxX/SURF4 family)